MTIPLDEATHAERIASNLEDYRRWVLQSETALRNSTTSQTIMRRCLIDARVTEESIVRVMDVLLVEAYVLRDHGKGIQTDHVALNALESKRCPVEVLSRACRCPNPYYRKAASANPNCREEDRVYAALLDLGSA